LSISGSKTTPSGGRIEDPDQTLTEHRVETGKNLGAC
jgi:hypothetical protein